jgi:zinc-binding alcohol dehydrogenase family protein
MKAVAYEKPLPIGHPESLLDVDLPQPQPGKRDVLVKVEAVSVNPVDTKVRGRVDPNGALKVLGFDAAGTVVAVGPDVTLFKPGDEVYYAGAIDRPGSNAEFQIVDERIVGRKPTSLSNTEAAALPLTSITAWELLFDRLGLTPGQTDRTGYLLVVGGAGGVGSIAIQLARQLTGLTVIATASREETRQWVTSMGAHHIVDHRSDLIDQIKAIAPGGVDYVLGLTATDEHFASYPELIKPQGKLALIDDPTRPVDITLLKRKSISLHWELMFTRSLFQTDDMIAQHALLDEVARMVDAGQLRTTLTKEMGRINADNLKQAHALLESGRSYGKVVLTGF